MVLRVGGGGGSSDKVETGDWRLDISDRTDWDLSWLHFITFQTTRTVRSAPRGVLSWQKTNKLYRNWKVFSDYLNKNSFSGNVDLLKVFQIQQIGM